MLGHAEWSDWLFVSGVTATRRVLCGFGLITNVATQGAYVRCGASWERENIKNRRHYSLEAHIILTGNNYLLRLQVFISYDNVGTYR
jgi:hypothetical protein